jgi:sulfoxide reductase heme-binding subunit YedZ
MSISAATLPTLGEAPFWYLTRSTGITGFVLLTIATAFGVAATQRTLASPSWPRFATQNLHRNVSLLGLAVLLVHIVTTLADGFVAITNWSILIPFLSDYRRLWVALGTISFDLILLIVATSLVRLRMEARVWRAIHLSAYALWPLTFLHFINTGTDAAHGKFGLWIAIVGAAVVGAALAVRLTAGEDKPAPVGSLVR